VSNLTIACKPCNDAKGKMTAAEFGHPEVQAQAYAPLRDAAAVNATRWAPPAGRFIAALSRRDCLWRWGPVGGRSGTALGRASLRRIGSTLPVWARARQPRCVSLALFHCASPLWAATVARCVAPTPRAFLTSRPKRPVWLGASARATSSVQSLGLQVSRRGSTWGGSPFAPRVSATSRQPLAQSRASMSATVGHSIVEMATLIPPRKERRRFLPRRERRGLRAAK
jgi:hypothetical protein